MNKEERKMAIFAKIIKSFHWNSQLRR